MRSVWILVLLTLIILAGCSQTEDEYSSTQGDTIPQEDMTPPEETSQSLGTTHTGSGKTYEQAGILGKKLTVTFSRHLIGMPKYRQDWRVVYDFTRPTPTLLIHRKETCVQGCSPAIPQQREWFIDYAAKRARAPDCTTPTGNLSEEDCFLQPNVYKYHAEMFGMLYENGEFIDIDTEGPLIYPDLLRDMHYTGDTTFKGVPVKQYKDMLGTTWYVYKDIIILGSDKLRGYLNVPTANAETLNVNLG